MVFQVGHTSKRGDRGCENSRGEGGGGAGRDALQDAGEGPECCAAGDGYSIKNDELCIKNDEFCITNDRFCIKYDGL